MPGSPAERPLSSGVGELRRPRDAVVAAVSGGLRHILAGPREPCRWGWPLVRTLGFRLRVGRADAGDEVFAGSDAELAEDVPEVELDGFDADVQALPGRTQPRDRFPRLAGGAQPPRFAEALRDDSPVQAADTADTALDDGEEAEDDDGIR